MARSLQVRRLLSQGKQSESEFESESDRFAAFCYSAPISITAESTFSREHERMNDAMNNIRYLFPISASEDTP